MKKYDLLYKLMRYKVREALFSSFLTLVLPFWWLCSRAPTKVWILKPLAWHLYHLFWRHQEWCLGLEKEMKMVSNLHSFGNMENS